MYPTLNPSPPPSSAKASVPTLTVISDSRHSLTIAETEGTSQDPAELFLTRAVKLMAIISLGAAIWILLAR